MKFPCITKFTIAYMSIRQDTYLSTQSFLHPMISSQAFFNKKKRIFTSTKQIRIAKAALVVCYVVWIIKTEIPRRHSCKEHQQQNPQLTSNICIYSISNHLLNANYLVWCWGFSLGFFFFLFLTLYVVRNVFLVLYLLFDVHFWWNACKKL